MQDVSFTDQDYRLWVLLHQTRDAVYAARDKELSRFEISTIQAGALFIIQAIGEQATPAEISRWLFRKPHSVSGLLNRMEKEGLIRKSKDLDKKNLVRVTLTDKGRQAYDHSLNRESIHEIISCLSVEEQQQLQSSLAKIRDRALRILMERELPFPPI